MEEVAATGVAASTFTGIVLTRVALCTRTSVVSGGGGGRGGLLEAEAMKKS